MDTRRSLSFVVFALIILVQTKKCSSTWNFSAVDLPNDVPISRFAIWRNRAFLAIPSSSKKQWDETANIGITLLVGGWPEPGNNYSIGIPAANPAVEFFPKSSKEIRNECEKLSSVTGLDVDVRGRLWVLDSPKETDCHAKILVYDLRRNDHEIVRTELQDVPKNNLNCLVIDPIVGIWGPRAYIGDPGDESIIIYSLSRRKWWRLRLLHHGSAVPRVYSTEMAMSRKHALLYITGAQSQDLFSVDLNESRSSEGPSDSMQNGTTQNATVKWLGTKMGSSSGMICDQRGGLHYFLVTEHASVRWDTKHDLKTSSHSILLQSEDVPCITDYRVDLQRNVWGLVNLENPLAKTASTNFIKDWNAQFRTIRIYKYNTFGP